MLKLKTQFIILLVPLRLSFGQPNEIATTNAFPNLTFNKPVFLTHSNDNTNRLFVVEQPGRILVFSNKPDVVTSNVFLDITGRVRSVEQEEGLLGLTFHPEYKSNGYFYINYTTNSAGPTPSKTVISRFQVSSSDSNQADADSEQVILEFDQPQNNHNGGMLAFGPDGFIYIGTGDGGGSGDPNTLGQDSTTLLGKILRIDINNTQDTLNYSIPSDNPFFANSQGFREEIWALGLRNPWRFSFDPVTGDLWAGDVGQHDWEEIDLIVKGGNYGWNIMEGFNCFNPPTGCDTSGLTAPIFEYSTHDLGCAITGGYVYRGNLHPGLYGAYIYGDYCSGRIWVLRYENEQVVVDSLLIDLESFISSFGIDQNNELYLLDYFDGKVIRLFGLGAPQNLYTLSLDNKAELHWNSPGEGKLQKYDIYRDINPNPTILIDSILATSTPDTSYVDSNVTNGQIYYYRVKAADSSGVESDFSNGDAGIPVSGQGSALSLDGTGDYLTVSHDSTIGIIGDITIEAWVFLNSISGTQTFVSKRDDATGRNTYQFGTQNSGKLFFFYRNLSDQSQLIQTNTAPLAASGWHHCVVVINGTTVEFYLDGNSYSADASISNSRDDASNRVLYLGAADLNQDFVSGFMDDIRIWNVPRDSTQIASNMNDPLRGDESDLVSLWHFNEPSGNQTANDAAPNSNNGLVNGDADFTLPDTALPIDLLIFTAKSDRGVVQLYWKTASETENLLFILERSETPDNGFFELVQIDGQLNKTTETEYRYLDRTISTGKVYYYRLIDVDIKGVRTIDAVVFVEVNGPRNYQLSQNYLNPFNSITSIRYDIPINAVVSMNIYDVLGRDVIQLVPTEQVSGFFTVRWDGKNKFGEDSGSGLYFYRIIAYGENGNKFSQVKKMVMMK